MCCKIWLLTFSSIFIASSMQKASCPLPLTQVHIHISLPGKVFDWLWLIMCSFLDQPLSLSQTWVMRVGWKGAGYGNITDNPTRAIKCEKSGSLRERLLGRQKQCIHCRIKKGVWVICFPAQWHKKEVPSSDVTLIIKKITLRTVIVWELPTSFSF